MYSIFSDAKSTWEQQLKDIENAKSSIYLEQYILRDFEAGQIGRQFVDALIEKAESGVEVRIILDFQGSLDLFKDTELNSKLKDSGLMISYYKTLPITKAFSPIRIMLRDHRKFLLVDHTISWIGGVVIGEEFRDWSDLMVRFTDLQLADYCNREFRRQIQRLNGGKVILAPLDKVTEEYELVGNSPGLGNRYCYEQISHQIMLAKKQVVIVTPYFAPPLRMRRVIERRLADGLEITLIISRRTDNRYADWSREMFLEKLVPQGLILKYLDYMNHAKLVIVDGSWCTFGSTNIDALSLITNHELNITTRDANLVNDITAQVTEWSDNCERVQLEDLEFHKMSFTQKLAGKLLKYFV